LLEIINLSKWKRRRKILDDINLKIPKGIYGITGPNGAGKTTLLSILASADTFSSGEIKYNGVSANKDRLRNLVGYLPQHFSMYSQLTVLEALKHLSFLKGVRYSTKELIHVLSKVNLDQHINQRIAHISGGMLRRLGIAQAILGDPEILIIDEPTSGLDVEEKIRFRNLIKSLVDDRTIILSSHDLNELESVSDHFAILKDGKILLHGDLKGIMKAKPNVLLVRVKSEELNDYFEKYQVTSFKKINATSFELRVLTDESLDGGVAVTPTLEECYISIIS
jgi:ABC-2 type transport system ATP-binding protein